MALEIPLLSGLKVQIHKTKSDTKPITCVIPQGSILGPLFFIKCLNNFAQISEGFLKFYLQMTQLLPFKVTMS